MPEIGAFFPASAHINLAFPRDVAQFKGRNPIRLAAEFDEKFFCVKPDC